MIKNRRKIVLTVLILCLALGAQLNVIAAESIPNIIEDEGIQTRAYRETLLVSYRIQTQIGGSQTITHQEYREFQFLNGYTSSVTMEPIPKDNLLPLHVEGYYVTIHYSFY